ncbi:hypothetical protein PSU4_58240 [Pseudonocardia sulfidoxydans NBRC 16205]|uniref:DUF4287 domain-containing protein n=1 Tax=Pseudonocardia sulfidoxydans NBRC 16205 TaxID=1223511 RepID=A0A511DPW7_9PSEU|nr:DUF4287 domain-containing protein [Pseudonocardia sulfidoxydans]GEL26870.1 hypothetical protein PSU4_58240 [Pseudonocardia sulfidoxydans NBRC 16205]
MPDDFVHADLNMLTQKTGKSLDEWTEIASRYKDEPQEDAVKKLKNAYGIGYGYAATLMKMVRGEQV